VNPFSVLDVDETAGDDAVRAAYLEAVRRHPPDRDPEGFQRIRSAYDAIRDAERRLAHRLFGPPPLDRLEDLLALLSTERHYVGPDIWLDVLRRHRS